MNNIIKLGMERELHFEANGKRFTGLLRIDRIEQTPKGLWSCHWSCDYLGEDGHVFGDDPLDSFARCLTLIRGLVVDAPKTGLLVWWKEVGDNCRV